MEICNCLKLSDFQSIVFVNIDKYYHVHHEVDRISPQNLCAHKILCPPPSVLTIFAHHSSGRKEKDIHYVTQKQLFLFRCFNNHTHYWSLSFFRFPIFGFTKIEWNVLNKIVSFDFNAVAS